jgi:hypothetical protein
MIDSLRQRFDNNNNRELACLINHRNLKIWTQQRPTFMECSPENVKSYKFVNQVSTKTVIVMLKSKNRNSVVAQ